jgi:hypothetical protein
MYITHARRYKLSKTVTTKNVCNVHTITSRLCSADIHINISGTNIATNAFVTCKNGFSVLQQVNRKTKCECPCSIPIQRLELCTYYLERGGGGTALMKAYFDTACSRS